MIPPLIVDEALRREILLIAITDHNSSANVQAVQKAADQSGLHVLPGMEIQTREDIHSLCLFDTLEQLRELQHIVDNTLPTMKNQPEHLGEQFIVNETGDFIRREDRLLIASSSLSINEAFALVTGRGGTVHPSACQSQDFRINRIARFYSAWYSISRCGNFTPPFLCPGAQNPSRHRRYSYHPKW